MILSPGIYSYFPSFLHFKPFISNSPEVSDSGEKTEWISKVIDFVFLDLALIG